MRPPRSSPMTWGPSSPSSLFRTPSMWLCFSHCWRYWTWQEISYYICPKTSAWCISPLTWLLGVWLPCTLARGEAADRSVEEPRCPGPGYYSSQPHGWVSHLFCGVEFYFQVFYLHFYQFLTATFISIVRCFQIDGPASRLQRSDSQRCEYLSLLSDPR